MIGLSGLAEIDGKTVQSSHGVMSLIVISSPDNGHNP
jgi:hypothetical protein